MSVLLQITLTNAEFDGTTERGAADFVFTRGAGPNHFIGTAADGVDVGIIDFAEILQALREQFGDFVDRRSLKTGARASVSDTLLERVMLITASADVAGSACGTHSPPNVVGAPGVRLRECPALGASETLGTVQGGGSGQVSQTLFASGVSGCVTFPTGMRFFIDSNVNVPANETLLAWLVPFYAPNDFGELARDAAQPPPVFA